MPRLSKARPPKGYDKFNQWTRTKKGERWLYSLLWKDNRRMQVNSIRNIKEIDTAINSGYISTYKSNAITMKQNIIIGLELLKNKRKEYIKILN